MITMQALPAPAITRAPACGRSCPGALAAGLVPVLNLLPPDHAFHVPTFGGLALGKYLLRPAGALARSRLGLCGILSLGHGAFFALGGYAMGMYLMRQIGPRGVYAIRCCPTSWSS
jgi:ABC-type branched-subunit amino acid transport system permease subunit